MSNAPRIIDMTPGKIGWGHNVIWATQGNEIETVALVTSPAPRIGDTLVYYTDDAEVLSVKPCGNPRDLYEIRVRALSAPNASDHRADAQGEFK